MLFSPLILIDTVEKPLSNFMLRRCKFQHGCSACFLASVIMLHSLEGRTEVQVNLTSVFTFSIVMF